MDEGFAKKLVAELQIERRRDARTSSQGYMLALAAEKTTLETKLIEARNEIAALRLENEELKDKIKSADSTTIEADNIRHFRAENDRLRNQNQVACHQVAELKQFLNDYGMVWVGTTGEDQCSNQGVGGGHAEVPHGCLPVSLDELRKNLKELNQMAGDSCGEVNLTVYSNGVQLHDCKFMPHGDVAARALVKDIQDGFFPYLLKDKFPDGVMLKLIDKSNESSDGSSGHHRSVKACPSNIHGMSELGAPASPMGTSKFLKKLPQAIIKDGQVVNIRSEIAALLGGTAPVSEPVIIPSTINCDLTQSQRMHVGPSIPDPSNNSEIDCPSNQDITTVQVKSDDGKLTYIVKLRYADTVGDLCRCIQRYLQQKGQGDTEFEVRSAFPPRCFERMEQSMMEAGLIPNATLFMRAKCSSQK